MTTTKTRQTLLISIAMQMWQCNAGCIARWSTSRASIEAAGHRIVAAAAMVDDFGRKHKTLTKNYF